MKFCIQHWNMLRDEVENKRGLAQFVSTSGKEAVHRQIEAMQSRSEGSCGDPLMDAHWMIVGNAMRLLGENGYNPIFLLSDTTPEGHDLCPLCVVGSCNDPHCPNGCRERPRKWIELAGRDTAEMWKERSEAAIQ